MCDKRFLLLPFDLMVSSVKLAFERDVTNGDWPKLAWLVSSESLGFSFGVEAGGESIALGGGSGGGDILFRCC